MKNYDELIALDVQVLAVSVDSVEKARGTRDTLKISFTVLSDAGRKVMELYGTRNPQQDFGEDPINIPTLVLIDRAGKVRWIHQAEDYRIRAPISKVLDAARQLR